MASIYETSNNRYEVSFSTEKAENEVNPIHDPALRIQVRYLSADTGLLFQSPRYGLTLYGVIERENEFNHQIRDADVNSIVRTSWDYASGHRSKKRK